MSVLDLDGLNYFQEHKYNPIKKDATMMTPVGRDDNGKLWVASNVGAEKFGVSGVGGSNPTLTRLWDAAGLMATPGTDQEAGVSGFDNYAPFNRKKCVGNWSVVGGKAVFTPQAYYGDADYAEDGTMGDYVAVDQPPVYWYEDKANGVLGVSGNPASGWDPHPACVDADGNVREHTYLPCYALALKDNHAVSLPGLQNYFGGYRDNWAQARTYGDGTSFASFAIIEPSAVDHLEWLLQTIEFATQNMQTVMNGAVSMPYNANHIITTAPAANKIVLTAAIGDLFVVGQSIYIGSDHSASPGTKGAAYNCITAIENCNEDGTLNASGTYRLITYDGTDRTSSITGGTTKVASRPWITGATQGYASGVPAVLGHTGSPISNSNGKYPMRYRWRENVYGNQNMTCLDLIDVRVADDDSYKLQWYHNPDLQYEGAAKYYPSSTSKPDAADLVEANGWMLLGVETPKESYKDGYIKEESADARWPHVRVPTLTTGGSASTYYADYANLVSSNVVRAVRRRGSLSHGASYGPRSVAAYYAPSYASWAYGSGLFFAQ